MSLLRAMRRRKRRPLRRRSFPEDREDDRDDNAHYRENPRQIHCSAYDSAEAQRGSYQGDDEKVTAQPIMIASD